MRMVGALLLAIAWAGSSGCSNALYFYETEKISLSVEGRPDSSQPVQGSLGLKQRVAIVVPPSDPDTLTRAKGEAMSMISSFRFRKDRGTLTDIGPVTIHTAFVTGRAADDLKPAQAEEIAIAQVDPQASTTEGPIADGLVRDLEQQGRVDEIRRLRDLLEPGCKDMTLKDQIDYTNITGAPRFRESLCNAVRRRLQPSP